MNQYDYFISGVWKNEQGRITHVLIHKAHVNGDFEKGEKRTEREIINVLKRDRKICVIVWEYPDWYRMAEVGYVEGKDKNFLRTDRDETKKDNLGNLINYADNTSWIKANI